ncbi:MAG: AI-2E family transporter, partial [Chloroflexota bacterium]
MTDMDGSAVAGSAEPAPPMPGVASPDATAGDVVVPARFLPLQLPSAPFWVVLIAGIAAVVLVVAASSALFVFAIGIALSFFLVPVVNWLVRHGIPRIGASILVVVVLVLITLTALLIGAYILIDQGTAFVQSLPSLFADLKADFDALELPTWLEEAVTAVGTTLQSTLANLDWGAWIIGLVQGVLGMVGLFF